MVDFRAGRSAPTPTSTPSASFSTSCWRGWHQLVGIAHVRLGRTLLHAGRFAEAAAESQAGYDLLRKQSAPPKLWIDNAREDLAAEADSLGR